jgi:hypothetical protein
MSTRIVIVAGTGSGRGQATSTPRRSAGLPDQVTGNLGPPDILVNTINRADGSQRAR